MKCHYEILGVELDSTSDDLKKAYRKLALEWHPDKNLNRLEEAKENFQLIQQAYEILSDPQERAWYDRHREDIIRGDAEEAYKDNCLNVYQYFNSSCFKGYNDDEKGFYTVYRQVFENITAEDQPFMDDAEDMEVPQFGYSYSSYDEVVHSFYAYWQSYYTLKTFSWVDKYDLTEARKSGVGRQVIRAMEKENKKLRDAHKKLRNEEVRELVAFVRKRDKRVQAQKKVMEEKKAEKAKKAEEKRRQQIQERNKALENYEETEWSSMSQFENHFNEIEAALDEKFGTKAEEDCANGGEGEELDELYCVACEKDFRSEKAFKNHENSKKHKENVALLKALMEEEEAEIAESQTKETIGVNDESEDASIENEEDIQLTRPDVENEAVESDIDDDISSKAMLDELIKSSKKSKRKKKKNKINQVIDESDHEVDKLEEVQLNVENITIVDEPAEQSTELNDASSKPTNKNASTKKKKKDKSSTAKKEATNPTQENEEIEKPTTVCGTCLNDFPSRNKLFEHLKSTGHAMFKNEKSSSSGSSKKKGKKKL